MYPFATFYVLHVWNEKWKKRGKLRTKCRWLLPTYFTSSSTPSWLTLALKPLHLIYTSSPIRTWRWCTEVSINLTVGTFPSSQTKTSIWIICLAVKAYPTVQTWWTIAWIHSCVMKQVTMVKHKHFYQFYNCYFQIKLGKNRVSHHIGTQQIKKILVNKYMICSILW